jgi:hypothetical protein
MSEKNSYYLQHKWPVHLLDEDMSSREDNFTSCERHVIARSTVLCTGRYKLIARSERARCHARCVMAVVEHERYMHVVY